MHIAYTRILKVLKKLMNFDDLEKVARIAQGSATVIAVLGGSLWGYYRFVRSRTFNARLSIQIIGTSTLIDGETYIVVKANVDNVGSGRTTIRQRGTAIRLWAHEPYCELDGSAELEPKLIGTYSIFEGHDVVEPLEKFSDCKVIQVNEPIAEAITIELRVLGERTIFRAKDVVFLIKREFSIGGNQ